METKLVIIYGCLHLDFVITLLELKSPNTPIHKYLFKRKFRNLVAFFVVITESRIYDKYIGGGNKQPL